MNPIRSILIVDDEPDMRCYLRTILELNPYRVETVSSGREALQSLQKPPRPDLILLDMLMPEMDGLETLRRLKELSSDAKVVMLSCVTEPKTVVEALHLGACDYIPKPFRRAELDATIQRHLSDRPPQAAPRLPTIPAVKLDNGSGFVAASDAMRKIRAQVDILAGVDVPILLLGESGTGKGVIGRLIHSLSLRSSRPFLKVNCAALPAELLESELFGYEPGAFTGATRSKPGKFELCDKGTILLDEIGELPTSLQAKLLQVLQDREFSRLGSRSVVRVNVRIIAATNVDVSQALASKKLREDLYYRLNAFTIHLPPLREQREGIPHLLRHFMSRSAAEFGRKPLPLSPVLLDAASRYDWPGNIRELENLVKRYMIIRDEKQILNDMSASKQELPSHVSVASPAPKTHDLKSLVRDMKSEAETDAISRVLEMTKWNRKEAARHLHISYKALLYKIRKYKLGKSDNALVWFWGLRLAGIRFPDPLLFIICLLAFILASSSVVLSP